MKELAFSPIKQEFITTDFCSLGYNMEVHRELIRPGDNLHIAAANFLCHVSYAAKSSQFEY